MNMKAILIIIIIVVSLLVAGFVVGGNNFNKQEIKVGDLTYQIPSNYQINDSNSSYVTVKSDDASIKIVKEASNKSLNKTVTEYVDMKESKNYSIQVVKLNANDVTIYKTNEVNNTKMLHYWFKIDNKVYEMTSKHGNQNTDKLVIELVNSIKKN